MLPDLHRNKSSLLETPHRDRQSWLTGGDGASSPLMLISSSLSSDACMHLSDRCRIMVCLSVVLSFIKARPHLEEHFFFLFNTRADARDIIERTATEVLIHVVCNSIYLYNIYTSTNVPSPLILVTCTAVPPIQHVQRSKFHYFTCSITNVLLQ